MCQHDPNQLETIVRQAATGTGCTVLTFNPPPQGSQRRRLWELDGHAHCPVIGVCLPIAALRRIVNKALGGQAVADDYELHCGAVTDAKLRTPAAEAIQRELDRRYMLPLRQAAQAKTGEALAAWWDQALRTQDVAGPFWAVLTHARCTPALEHRVLGDVHMLQHQAGMAARVDVARFEALVDENTVMARELGAAKQRSARQTEDHTRRCEAQQAEIVRLRAQLITRDTDIHHLREDLQALQAAVPGLKVRFELGRENQRQAERIHELERGASQLLEEAQRQRRRADELAARLHELHELHQLRQLHQQRADAIDADANVAEPTLRLDAQAVLCVGGRTAAVPLYRHIVEKVGGRFLHHDGGEEDSSARLDATLAAADMVICQTGCISHNAYWRVKDHCKRTGKRCVFVETPSTAGIKRALIALAPSAASAAPMAAQEAPP